MDSNLIKSLFGQINNIIDFKLKKLTRIESATVINVNNNETVDVVFPHNSTVYHNIQNQSIYRDLKSGDNVKVIIENGNIGNMWIIGAFGNSSQQKYYMNNTVNFDSIYPIGAIYMSVNPANPQVLFGGKWEPIKDRFLLSAGDEYFAGSIGGEKQHQLTIDEMPSHTHKDGTDGQNGLGVIGSGHGSAVVYYDANAKMARPTTSTGGDKPHNNMPPYLTVYMWKRVK